MHDELDLRRPLSAHVRLSSDLPVLLLEDSDMYLERITCHGSLIDLDFHDTGALDTAWIELKQYPELLVITSHTGCNTNGERRPYL